METQKVLDSWESPGGEDHMSLRFESIGNGEVRVIADGPIGAPDISVMGLGEVNELKRFLMRVERESYR